MEERVGAAFGRFPGVFQQLPGGLEIALSPPQVGQRDQGWEFLLREANRPGPGECMAQAFVGTIAAAQGQRSAALEPGGPGEIALVPLLVGQLPGTVGLTYGGGELAHPEGPLGQQGPDAPFPVAGAMGDEISRARRSATSAGPETPRAASTCPKRQ